MYMSLLINMCELRTDERYRERHVGFFTTTSNEYNDFSIVYMALSQLFSSVLEKM